MKDLLVVQPGAVDGHDWLAVLPINEQMVEDFEGAWSYYVETIGDMAAKQDVNLTSDAQWWVGDISADGPPYQFPYADAIN